MLVRQAELSDLEQIDAFDVFSGDRRPEILRGETLVAVEGDTVAGYLVHDRNFFHRPFVWFACVKPAYYRQGVNKMLFKHVENLYAGSPQIFTSTEADNLPMLNFFKNYGYEQSGHVDNLQKVSELIFVKKLSG